LRGMVTIQIIRKLWASNPFNGLNPKRHLMPP
jgi:hypothetical protein